MCGIAGLLLNTSDARVDVLDAMVDALARHGSDDRGTFVDGRVAVGVRRLSIADPEGGHLPVADEDESIRVVFDGACYNSEDLRAELVSAGRRFTTGADTEVVLHGYEQWGARGLAGRLNGDYAFCVWDARRGVATLVRDRLGVRPLYFVSRALGLAFSSEMRSLARSGLCLPKLDEEAVWSYLFSQFTPSERTPLAGVARLPAGHMLEWDSRTGAVRVERYWELPEGGERTDLTFEEAAAETRRLLETAVERQMVAGVPVGCFLSGGLASSVVAALMEKYSDHPVRTFSICFPAPGGYAETDHAERVGREIGARHTTVEFEEAAFLEHIEESLARVDEPVADAGWLATYALSRRAAREVKVVLTGEGADEVFGGYASYRRFVFGRRERSPGETAARAAHLRRVRERLGQHLGQMLPAPVRDLASSHSGFPYTAQPEFIWCMLGLDRRPSLETFRRSLAAVEERFLPAPGSHTPLQRALYVDTSLRLGHDLTTRLNNSTMAHGLEGRVPLLDHRLVEFAFRLPDRFKVGAEEGKLVLREATRDLLPPEIVGREKRGFGVPVDRLFRTTLREFARETLLDSVLVEEGLLSREGMEAVLYAHCELDIPLGRTIWSVVTLDRWWRHIRREIVEALPERGAIPVVSDGREPSVDILIPIYESFSLVRDCVRSIQAFTQRPFRAILLDDAGSRATHRELAGLIEGDPRFELVRNERNLGFVRNCLAGFERCTADYVVLLNSDTVVAPGWLERMVECAESDPAIAVVNPLTNESGNTSVRMAPGLNLLSMTQRVAEVSERRYPDLTTGVGMCMLIRRSAIELLGSFDTIFENAYCEESDMCMRFTEAGLRVVAADDAFIYHKGWASYDEAKKTRFYERNRKIFDARWAVPYERDWLAYSRRDPLQYMRDRLLRGTLAKEAAGPDMRAVVGNRLERLETRRALAATADGARASAAVALLAARSKVAGREEFLEWNADRIERPLVTFDGRAETYPTREYVARLPKPAPGKLRVTFLVESLPIAGGVISIVQLARELLLAGHDVQVVTESPEFVPEALNLWVQPLVYRDRTHLLEAFPESDVVVATFWVTAHRYLRDLHARYRFASVYFIQDYEAWFYPDTEFESQRKVIQSYREADHPIVMSRWLAGKLAEHGVEATIVPLGLDLGIFYPRDDDGPRPQRVISVAAPGPSSARRGFGDTVEVFRLVHEARPDVELVFFGAEPDRMPDVPFPYVNAGRIRDQQKVAELISSSDVLLDASIWQGFGRPGLEALACGTVPVLTRVGGLVEYAEDGENCLLVPPCDPPAAAEAILRLLGDPALYARLKANGPSTAARYSHEIEAVRHMELYERWARAVGTARR